MKEIENHHLANAVVLIVKVSLTDAEVSGRKYVEVAGYLCSVQLPPHKMLSNYK